MKNVVIIFGNFLIENPILLTSLLTLVGWYVLFKLGLKQQSKQLLNNAQMKAYEDLYEEMKIVQNSGHILYSYITKYSLPIITMETQHITKDENSALFEAKNIWNDFIYNKLSKSNSDFTYSYLRFWSKVEMWMALMPELETAKHTLFEEFKDITNKIYIYRDFLQTETLNEYDWRKWDIEKLKKESNGLAENFTDIYGGYLDDFMGLIHNKLVTPILGHKKELRNLKYQKEPIDFKILTIKGIENYKHIPKI